MIFCVCILIILEYSCLLVTYAFHFPGVEKVVVVKLVFVAMANEIINH